MAGFSKIYCIGGLGGFDATDRINPLQMQIWLGEGNRQWLEVHYFDSNIKPIGKIRTVIPAGPDHPDALIDACIAFFPDYFKDCGALSAVAEELANVDRLDFHLGNKQVPKAWVTLREQARPLFRRLVIFQAKLERLA